MKDKKEKKAKIEINDGHYLELLDRTYVVLCNVQDHLVDHPLAQKKKKIRKKLESAGMILADAYQDIGHLMSALSAKEHNDLSCDDNLPF
jgi:hypothetical protein